MTVQPSTSTRWIIPGPLAHDGDLGSFSDILPWQQATDIAVAQDVSSRIVQWNIFSIIQYDFVFGSWSLDEF